LLIKVKENYYKLPPQNSVVNINKNRTCKCSIQSAQKHRDENVSIHKYINIYSLKFNQKLHKTSKSGLEVPFSLKQSLVTFYYLKEQKKNMSMDCLIHMNQFDIYIN